MLEELGEDRLLQLTDDDRTGAINTRVVEAACESATATFESYARTRYSLPVPATFLVKKICRQLARYELELRRATSEEKIISLQKSYYTPNLNLLKDIQAGKAALDIPAATETAIHPASPDKVLRPDDGALRPASSRGDFSREKLIRY